MLVAMVGSSYVTPSVALVNANTLPAARTLAQLIAPCQCDTSIPYGRASANSSRGSRRSRRHPVFGMGISVDGPSYIRAAAARVVKFPNATAGAGLEV